MTSKQTKFPRSQPGLNYALVEEPILLNGMKVLFDQPVSVYPVPNLERIEPISRHEPQSNHNGHPK